MITAREFVATLANVDLHRLGTIFNYLADHEHELILSDRRRLSDGIDFSSFLRELGAACDFIAERKAASVPLVPVVLPRRAPRTDLTCPDCDHEHEGREECGKYLGEATFCRCTSKVLA